MLSKSAITSLANSEAVLNLVRALQTVPQLVWSRGICFALSLLLIYTLTQWLWLLLPSSAPAVMPQVSNGLSQKQSSAKNIDIAQLQSYQLFGALQADASAKDEVFISQVKAVDAEPTRLKLKLTGIVQAANVGDALAMIEYQGKEEQYAIGEKLPIGRVVLSQIHRDHVIIENAGRYESIQLFDGESTSSATEVRQLDNSNKLARQDKREDQQVSSMARDYRKRLYKNPSSLADALRISPQQKDGVMQGYKISPGRDKEQFEQLGLQANDVVTQINGIALDDPAKAVEVYKIMRSAKEANFVIDRQGQSIEMMVSLSDDASDDN